MKNIADLHALIIGLTSDEAGPVVESETDPRELIFSLILLGYSKGKDSNKLNNLSKALDDNLGNSDDVIIAKLSKSITDIF